MTAKNQHDWAGLKQQLIQGYRSGAVKVADYPSAAKYLGVVTNTLQAAARREWKVSSIRELLGESLLNSEMPTRMGTDIEEGANTLEINYVGEHVHSLDELIKLCKVDLSIWRCVEQRPNAWEAPMKIKRGEAELIVVVPLYQIKAHFVRIRPVAISPTIQPVELPGLKYATPKAKMKGLRRALIIADTQVGFRRRLHTAELVPFHDRRVLDLALQVLKMETFDNVSLIGDILDMSEWSTKYLAEPEFYWTTQPALLELAWWLRECRQAAPGAVIDMYEGNHDMRPETAIITHLKAAYELRAVDELDLPHALSVPRLLALHQLKINYLSGYPDNVKWLNKNVLIRHGDVVRAGPGDSAKAVVNKTTYTTVFGHIHRRELVSRRLKGRDGDVFQTAFCPGCACHIDGRLPGSKSDDQWQQGLAVVEYVDDHEAIIPIPIENGVTIYKGQLLIAGEMDDRMNEMLRAKLEGMK